MDVMKRAGTHTTDVSVAQVVEQLTFNQWVGGSIPLRDTTMCECSSMVERQPSKLHT